MDNAPSVEEPWREYAWAIADAIDDGTADDWEKEARACVAVEEKHTAELRAERDRIATQRDEFECEKDGAWAEVERLLNQPSNYGDGWKLVRLLRTRAEKAEATIARVEALIASARAARPPRTGIRRIGIAELEATLRGPEPAEGSTDG